MKSSFKSALVLTTAAAIALTTLDLRPAAATPAGDAAIVKQDTGATDLSAARKKKRRGRGINPAVPLAAFGAIIGTIGGIAAEQRRRDYYDRYYDGPYQGGYVYQQPYGYRGPYEPPARAYQHQGYNRGYRGPQPGAGSVVAPGSSGGGGGAAPGDRVAP